MPDLQIVLLGKTGTGKSASGNTIIRSDGEKDAFKIYFSPASGTERCQSENVEVDGQTISVIDTVGMCDTPLAVNLQNELEEIFRCACDGIDVFLLVIRLDNQFLVEDQNVVNWIQKNFGAKVLKYTILLFTHGDDLKKNNIRIEDYISKSDALKSVVHQCAGGYHVFNNEVEDPSQVTELLKKIYSLRGINGYRRYTEQDYATSQKQLLHKKCVAGAALGGVGGALGGGAIAANVGVFALTAVAIGAVGGAVLIAGVGGAGIYLCARKYISKTKDKKRDRKNK